ncbi:hypothetical protein HMPREF9141_0666 [Prevotella multiformis DSM 16608]|uniref:Uncharacterized protein n=1 Tax=Prevotella multiformis DSM 16608 TaxID=888743 RepID=F0F500_9BACT|nr:hypothetical protein HMPREF9141_0666 [Prevotella multiformis DSM 16608]
MVLFNELFQTVRLSKWYLHFDTPSFSVSFDIPGDIAIIM